MSERLCRVCGWRDARADGLCATDYEYRRRTNHERPAAKVVAHLQRRLEGKKR